MHCACIFAARVRWERRLRKSLGCHSRLLPVLSQQKRRLFPFSKTPMWSKISFGFLTGRDKIRYRKPRRLLSNTTLLCLSSCALFTPFLFRFFAYILLYVYFLFFLRKLSAFFQCINAIFVRFLA